MKEIRKYFKNAKIVECLMAGTYEIDLKTIYQDKWNHYWCRCKDSTDHCLLFEDGEFAKIIEVKKPKQETRMYSEKQVIELLREYRVDLSSGKTPNIGNNTKYWFEQFKKK